jgi:dienelactone hydrolase
LRPSNDIPTRDEPDKGLEPTWFAEAQRKPARLPASADSLAPLLFDQEHKPIGTSADWRRRRSALRGRWLEFLGEIPRPEAPPRPRVIQREELEGGVIRQRVVYEAEPGFPVEAYVLEPAGEATVKRPGVVVLHSTTPETIRQPAGLAGEAEKHIGLHLARRGYVAICPKCFLWEYGDRKDLRTAVDWLNRRYPGVTGMSKMLFDAGRALDLLAAWPGVDPLKMGAIGHSLGAKEALYLAAFDDRVRAAVFSEGGIGLSSSNWEAPWYLGDAIRRPGFPLDHAQLMALVAPRAFLIVGGDSADGDASWPYVEATRPVWTLEGAPTAVGLVNHRMGHAFPSVAQSRSYQWLDWWLAH